MLDLTVVSGSNEIFKTGEQIAFFGRSNVGKSSTINAILNNKNAAKTSSTPGKTVTFNFYNISKDDENIRYLVDLPGYGYAKHSEKFREKIRRKLLWYLTESNEQIKYFCLITDAKAGLTEIDLSAIDLAKQLNLPVILLVNKIDRCNQKAFSQLTRDIDTRLQLQELQVEKILYYSAKTKKGINEVKSWLEI